MPVDDREGLSREEFDSRQQAYEAPDPGVPGPSRRTMEVVERDNLPSTSVVEKPAGQSIDGAAVTKTLEALNQRITGESNSAKLLADPAIRAYLDAKARGVPVKLVTEEELQQRTAPPQVAAPEVDLDTMTNAQLVAHLQKSLSAGLMSAVEKSVGSRFSALEQRIGPKIDQADAAARQVVQSDLQSQLVTARTKHKDLDLMMPQMMEINKSVQGVTVEELYHLAKVRSGVPLVSQNQIETERPNETPRARKPAYTKPTNTLGANGFRALAIAAQARQNIGRDEDDGR